MSTVARIVLSLLTLLPLAALGKEPADGTSGDEGLPLETTRTIEFETDEATWLSLDISPDGLTLVLELLGDLYRLPIGGGEATRLTEGPAFDSQPRFSPDGDWIAFLSDRDGAENVWIARKDGSEPKKLSQDKQAEFASPAWTPDGEYVIVSRSSWGLGTYELWMYHVLGGSGVQITRAKASPQVPRGGRHNALGVVASPDERFLYYARRTGGFSYNATFPMWQIARRDRVTGIEDVLTQAPGSAIRPVLSPDGTRLVYGTRRDARTGLRIRDLTTGEDRWLAYPVQRDDQESRFTRDLLPGYAFAPDGQEIVISSGGRIERIDVDTGARTIVPFTAKISQRLGPQLDFPHRVEEGTVWARLIQSPVASPDGKLLAFSSLTRLYVKPLEDGARPKRIADDAYQPAWSPDGRWLAYVTWTSDGGHLWKTRADGSGRPVRLSEQSAFYSDPVWSPDGSRIVALRASTYSRVTRPVEFGSAPGLDLIWLPADGGEARLVIPARGVGRPHFTRDPERIYLYLSGGAFGGSGDHGLVSMRYDGTDRRTHLKVTGPGLYFAEEPVSATEIRMRPDGQWALAHVSNQLYLVAVPPFSNETPTVNIGSPTVPLKKLTDVGADYFGWADGGDTLTWAIGASFFRRPFDSVSFQTPPATDDDDGKGKGDDTPEEPQPAEATADEHIVTIELPRHTPRGTVVLRGATVITMRGDEVIPNADVVVQDNRILAVGTRGRVEVPPTAQEIDVTGRTIVPGFVDTHAHWFEIRRGVLDTQNWSFLANLAYGVTAGLDVQTSTNDMFAYQDLVDVGAILGPRAYSTGPGIFSNNAFETVEQAKGVLRRYRDYYRTRNLKSYIVGNRRQRQLVAQAAYELQMMPTTEGALDLKLDLTHVLDGFSGNEHALPVVPLYKDVVELVARSGMGYTPTLLVSYGGPWAENHFYTTEDVHDDPKLNRFTPHEIVDQKSLRRPWFHADEHVYAQLAAEAAKIIRAGGKVGVGAHGQLQGLGYHWELWALAAGGLTPLEALRAATLHGAQIIGYGEDLGSVEPGKLADLVILTADPRDDIRNTNAIDRVMKNGELFDADTMNQVWPEKKPLPPLWWWDEQP